MPEVGFPHVIAAFKGDRTPTTASASISSPNPNPSQIRRPIIQQTHIFEEFEEIACKAAACCRLALLKLLKQHNEQS